MQNVSPLASLPCSWSTSITGLSPGLSILHGAPDFVPTHCCRVGSEHIGKTCLSQGSFTPAPGTDAICTV